MNNNELFMNDTFDNFTFVETEQLLSNKESEKTQNNTQDILLDDSCFLTQPDQNKKNEQNSWSEDFFSTTDFASQHSPANKQKVSSESSEEEPTGQTVINKNSDNNNQIQVNTVFSSSDSNEINFCSIDFSESFELDSVKINVDYKISDSESGKVICDGIGDKSAEILSALCCDNVNSTFVVCNKKVREKFSSQTGTKNTNPNNLKCNQNVLSEKRKHSESDNEDEPNRRVKSPKLIEDEILKPNNEKYNFPKVKTTVTCCDEISEGPSKDEVQTKKYTDKRLHFLDNENIEKTNYDDNEKDNIDNVEDKSQICLKIKTAKPTDDYSKHEESNDNKISPNIIVNIDNNVKYINSQQSHENDNPPKKICFKGDPTQLSSWGLPEIVLEKYRARHIENMFEWQVECLSNKKVIESCSNLIYSAPTSAGKTLVSEILAIKTIFERQKKVIFILPFVSIVREKMYYFQDILGSSGIRVEGFMGSYNPPGGFQAVQMAICTMEKANSLINRLLEEGKLEDIGAIIVDEMHLLGDISRGYLLELLLTKLKYISLHDPDIKIQIIGMSATLPNLSTLAKWLDAELYTTTFRPIPLEELAHVSGEIYNTKFELIRKIEPLQDVGADTDNILQLCLETVKTSCSVLIFCPTKNWCESLAQQISVAFLQLGKSKTDLGNMLRDELKPNMIIEVMEQLKYCPAGLDDVLKKTVSFGVAYHHAGLTMEERDIIEGGFRSGAIRVLIATSTLSSGVNLPARRVIVRSPTFHGKPIDVLTYKQMIGRAGRMGKDEKGESILICQKNDYQIAKELMQAHLKPVCSCLEGAGKLKRAILEVITSRVATSPEDVSLFTNCTLLAVENEEQSEHLENPIEEAVNFLRNNEFIKLQASENGTQKYVATSLGKACLSSSMAPDEGLALFTELEKARQCFVLETELHLIYLVTPYSACHSWGNIDWMFYLQLWERLPASMKRVGELVGVRESYLVNATRGQIQTQTNKQYHKLLIHKRFFVALALQDLVNEKTLGEVCAKFNCNRGMLQSLQQSASSFAGMVTAFSKQLGWTSVEILISQFQDRLQFGVSRDLLDLMRLPILNGKIARALYNGGMETLIQLANSDVMTIENTLNTVMPFEREKEREGESEYEARRRNKIKNVWISGREGLTVRETAEILIHDARNYLKMEMGLADAKWEDQNEVGKVNNKEQEQRKIDGTLHQESSNHNIGEDKKQNFNEQQENNVDQSQDKEYHDFGEDKEQNINEQQHENNVDQNQDKEENLICDYKDVESDSSQFSVFNESFTLQLSSDSLTEDNSPAQTDKQEVEIKNVCPALETLINESNNMNMSDDIFTESFDESKSPLNKISRTNLNDAVTDANMPKQKIITKNMNLPSCSKTNVTYIEDAIEKFSIIDVCGNDILFEKFCGDLLCVSSFSLSAGCTETEEDGKEVKKVEGIAISWGDTVVYYLSLENHLKQRVLQLLKTVIEDRTLNIKVFDCKEQVKCLKKYCNLDIYGDMEDPKIADWLLEPEEAEKNLDNLALLYYPQVAPVLKLLGTRKGVGSVGLEVRTAIHSKLRCCVESLVTWYVSDALKSLLLEKSAQFLNVYGVEMKCCLLLAKMEIVGMGVSRVKLQKLADDLRQQMENIERKCFSLTGRRFSLSSPIEVSRILGMHKGKKVSTRKEVLEKCDHPVAGLIIQWRKISFTMTKVIYPFIQTSKIDRLFGCYITHTATGRITMHEPNIQTIPKNFDIVNPLTKETCVMSCRTAFAAAENCSLVSADWCQLELRLLAHLSQDKILKKIMNSPGDVFKSVASKWYNVSESDVDDKLRQNAKHICYGIIYGMGYKTLAEQLSIPEEDAMEFMESFKNAYPGVQVYIQKTIEECKRNGYVETISGRRRYLAHIKDSNVVLRGQAERQAVNTTIQGSAADMAKKAMITIDEKLIKTFCKSKLKPNLVLHLHDELIYEVPTKYIHKVAKIVKNSMENAVKLTVPFPVKLRVGLSWGELTEYSL